MFYHVSWWMLTYCSHFVLYTYFKSLHCTPWTNAVCQLYLNKTQKILITICSIISFEPSVSISRNKSKEINQVCYFIHFSNIYWVQLCPRHAKHCTCSHLSLQRLARFEIFFLQTLTFWDFNLGWSSLLLSVISIGTINCNLIF